MPSTNKTPFEILGVSRYSTQKEIRNRYLELCKTYHPDVAGPNSKVDFREITVAYEFLINKNSLTRASSSSSASSSAAAAGHTRPINTKLWTKRSYMLGLGIVGLTYLYFYEPEDRDKMTRVLPHEINSVKDPTPWKTAGTSFREWRKR